MKKYKFKKLYFSLNMFIFYINIILLLCKYKQRTLFFKSSEVTLKIKETGNIKIFSDNFFKKYSHCEVYLNDSFFGKDNNEYYFESYNSNKINIIKIIFNDSILTTKNMFEKCDKIIEIDLTNFDTSKVNDMSRMFSDCSSLTSLNLFNFNTSLVNDMSYMFNNCSSLISLNLSSFDTSEVIHMNCTFSYCKELINLDLSNFNTAKIKYMNNMFHNCKNLIFLNLSSFDTSEVTDMASMFYKCYNLTSLDLSNFDTSKVTRMSLMFSSCSSLNFLNVSNFNTSKVSGMISMFSGCSNLKSLDLSNFDTSKVTDMTSMFSGCSNLALLDLSNFNTSQVTSLYKIFAGCKELKFLNLSGFITSKVTDMTSMFFNCSSLESLDLSNFDTSLVTSMSYMFVHCEFKPLNLSSFDTSNVTKMDGMFYYSKFDSLDLSNFNTSKVTNMTNMFRHTYYSSLNLSNFDTSNLQDMSHMFYRCFSLTSLDLSNFDTSKVVNMSSLFHNCEYLAALNISNINTSNVVNMNSMFSNCRALSSLNLYNFDTSKVNNMGNMFYNCTNLSLLNLSNFDTSNVLDMNHLFYNCSLITSLDLSNFNITNVKNFNNIFYGCKNIEYINLDISNINPSLKTENMFLLTPDNLIVCIDNEDESSINILPESKKYQCNNSYHENKYICYMKNSSIYSEHICDICQKNLLMNYSELNISNTHNVSCFESPNDYYINDSLNNFNETDMALYNSESFLKSENYQYFSNYSSENIFDFVTSIIVKLGEKNETIQNIIDNLLKEPNMKEINNGEDKKVIIEYEEKKEKVKCSCDLKLSINLDIKFDKKQFFKSFTDINNIININVIKCYKIILDLKNLLKNDGCFIVGSIIILYFITLFIFVNISFHKLKKELFNITSSLKITGNPLKKRKSIKGELKMKKKFEIKKIKNKDDKTIKKSFFQNQITLSNVDYSNNIINPKKYTCVEKNKVSINYILEKKDFELNSLDYEEAFQIDHRNYCEYYISILKYNHPLLFSFGSYNDLIQK